MRYYQNEGCSHIWTTSKETGSNVTHLTNPPQKYTALGCPSCGQVVAKFEHVEPDEVTLFCPACGHRWGWEEPKR